jgi:hypothetical protein
MNETSTTARGVVARSGRDRTAGSVEAWIAGGVEESLSACGGFALTANAIAVGSATIRRPLLV